MSKYVRKFSDTGICEIDVDEVIKDWRRIPHLWCISQWKDKYTIIRQVRKNSTYVSLKAHISKIQASTLMFQLKLIQSKSPVFRWSASTWRVEDE